MLRKIYGRALNEMLMQIIVNSVNKEQWQCLFGFIRGVAAIEQSSEKQDFVFRVKYWQ